MQTETEITFPNGIQCSVTERQMDKYFSILVQSSECVHLAISKDQRRYSGSLPVSLFKSILPQVAYIAIGAIGRGLIIHYFSK